MKLEASDVVGIFIIVIIIGTFTLILHNGKKHSKYLKEFDEKCQSNGGMMVVPKGVKGWPVPSCVNPEYYIDMDK